MKKLKTVLILLLAALLSLGLFACKKKDDTPPDTPGPGEQTESTITKIKLSNTTITLTDSDEAAAYEAERAKIVVTVTDNDGNEDDISVDDCNWEGNITYHEVGEYPITVSPKSASNRKATLTVVIDHDWGTETNGIKTCRYSACGARQETREENVVMHYGTFHEGTDPKGYADAKAEAGWTETAAYTNTGTNSAISRFGSVGNHTVPTLTAGQLEPEMTITIRGKAKTTAEGTEAAPAGVWGHQQEQWNSPSLGIADRYATFAAHPDYKYGISVIVRQEGWVLYNGIGDTTANNSLAGIMGGTGTSVGDWRNYGSHPSETDTTSPKTGASNYVHGSNPATLDWSTVEDWWVYSTGTILQSGTYYQNEDGDDFEYSWTYRKDGVIEISYSIINGVARTTLKAYIKVPDSEVGYYDTIIHGDYNDMTITESVITTKRTPKDNGFTYKGLKSGANKVYAENTAFDASTLNVTVKYEQTGEVENTLRVANSQVYYYKGNLSREDLVKPENKEELESLDASKWVSLGTSNLVAGAIYKLHIAKGGKTFVTLIGEDDFEVFPNKVGSALGADVNVIEGASFANNGKVGAFNFSVDTTAKNVVLTLAGEGYVQALTQDQIAKFSGGVNGATKYVAIRLNGAELGEGFTDSNVTVKKDSDTVPSIAKVEGDDLYLVIALKEAGKYTIEGAQDSDIVLDLTALKGFAFSSAISGDLDLFNGGTVTLTYTVPADTKDTALKFSGGGSSDVPVNSLTALAADKDWDLYNGYVIDSATLTGTTLKVVVKVDGASLVNYAPATFKLSNASDAIVDTVDYKLALDAASYEGKVAGTDSHFAFIQNSGTLSVIKAFPVSDGKLEDGKIVGRFTLNLNNGDFDTFKKNGLIEVSYRVVGGELVFLNAPAGVTGSVTFLGTYGDNRDTDKGAFVIVSIPTSSLGISGDYYFDFVEGAFDPTGAPAKIHKASGLNITEETLSGKTAAIVATADGSCYELGLYGWEIKSGDKVLCYAGAATSGGKHVDKEGADGPDGVCDLCGGTMESAALPVWGYTKEFEKFSDGDVVTVQGKWIDTTVPEDGDNFGLIVSILNGSDRYWLRTDGFFVGFPGGAWWTDADLHPYNEETAPEGFTGMGSTLPYNTLNGVVTNDGTALNADTLGTYFAGKSYYVIVKYVGTTVTIQTNIYNADGSLSLQYENAIYDMTNALTLEFTSQPAATQDGDPVFTKSSVVNSAIDTVTSATVDSHTAPTDIEYGTSKKDGYVVVGLSGVAAKEGTAYYAAFDINFKQALVDTATVKLVDKDGNAITGAKCTLAQDHLKVSVYLPIADGLTEAYLDFTNYEASTMQADIKLDLTDLACSDVKGTVAGTGALTIAEGTFTITYTGDVKTTDTLVVGDVSKALSELATKVDLGNGYSAQYDSTAKKVTLTKHEIDYSKVVTGVTVRLERDGILLARNVIDAALTVSGGTALDGTEWSVKAVGTQLILFSNEGGQLTLNVNAGKETDVANLGNFDVSISGSNFAASNVLTKAGKVVVSKAGSTTLTVLVFDLSVFGVEAATPYGYQVAEAEKYYTVNASRTIASADITAGGTKETFAEGDCITNKVEGYKASDSFYYDVEVTAAGGHTWQVKDVTDKKGYDVVNECSVCHILQYVESENITQVWGRKTNNTFAGWDANSWEKFASVVKGGSYTVVGTLHSSREKVWNLPGVGLAPDDSADCDAWRFDGWNFDLNAHGMNPEYPSKLVDADKTYYEGATLTITVDYQSETTITISAHLVNNSFDKTAVVLLTPTTPADSYTIWMHQDGNTYEASRAESVVPADQDPAPILSKHVHAYDPETHRCPDDGELDPDHEHSYKNGVCSCGEVCVHNFDATTGECSICDMKLVKKAGSDKSYADHGFADSGIPGHVAHTTNEVIEFTEGEAVVFRAKIANDTGKLVYLGIVTQLWAKADVTTYDRATELAFQQGNNWCLSGAWQAAGKGVSGNGNAYPGTGTTESVGAADKSGWMYEITVWLQDGVVTIVYKAWTNGTASGTPNYSGIATYSNVEETNLVVGIGSDGATFDGNIQAYTATISPKA